MFSGMAHKLIFRISFRNVCSQLSQIEGTGSMKEKQAILQNLLSQKTMTEVRQIINFIICEPDQLIKPDTAEIQVEAQTIYAALRKLFKDTQLTKRYDDSRLSDLDYYVEESKNPPELHELYESINRLRVPVGNGSELQKQEIVQDIIQQCSSREEIKFVIRFLQKRMRIGLKAKSIETALAALGEEYSEMGINLLGFSSNNPRIGVPIEFQLAKGFNNVEGVVQSFISSNGKYFIEPKYDGERIQLHYDGSSCELVSRIMEKRGWKYPHLRDKLMTYFQNLGIKSIILDTEMICFDQDNKIVNFQDQMSLKITEAKLALVVFDILHLDDQSLLSNNYSSRRKTLLETIIEDQVVKIISSVAYENPHQIEQLFAESLRNGYEGLMIKNDLQYQPGSRVAWAKLKPFHDMDLVVVGANYGNGKRSKYFGSFLMAIRGNDVFYPIARIGTGFDEQELAKFTEQFTAISSQQKPKNVYSSLSGNLRPDAWIEPKYVWEVQYDSISQSPVYHIPDLSQMIQGYDGISLRFIRFIRERPDKDASNATHLDEALGQLRRRLGVLI